MSEWGVSEGEGARVGGEEARRRARKVSMGSRASTPARVHVADDGTEGTEVINNRDTRGE